jgi:hypothetical protein
MSGFCQKAGFSGEEMGQEHPATVLVVRGQIIEGARGAGLCRLIVARSVAELPERDGWIYGLKLDGYRALLLKEATRLRTRWRNSRMGLDGKPFYQALQHHGSNSEHQIVFYASTYCT